MRARARTHTRAAPCPRREADCAGAAVRVGTRHGAALPRAALRPRLARRRRRGRRSRLRRVPGLALTPPFKFPGARAAALLPAEAIRTPAHEDRKSMPGAVRYRAVTRMMTIRRPGLVARALLLIIRRFGSFRQQQACSMLFSGTVRSRYFIKHNEASRSDFFLTFSPPRACPFLKFLRNRL